MSGHRIGAFTLRELVFVLAAIGLVLVLWLSVIDAARGPNRRSICQNNIRNLALAAVHYDSIHGHYPGYRDEVAAADGTRLSRPLVYMILPQLERSDLYEAFSAAKHPRDGMPGVALHLLVCPTQATAGVPGCSYVFNTGMPDWASAGAPPDWPANGVFQDRYLCGSQGHKLADNSGGYLERHDGTTSTLLFSERVELGRWTDMAEHEVGFVWHPRLEPGARPGRSPDAPAFDAAKYQSARPSSGHPGHVNVAFADAHVRSVDVNIAYRVYAQLMTPWGAKAAYPGLRSGSAREVEDAFRSCPVPDELGP
jgi:prepilin-type processing-associated H-X9-DG protein